MTLCIGCSEVSNEQQTTTWEISTIRYNPEGESIRATVYNQVALHERLRGGYGRLPSSGDRLDCVACLCVAPSVLLDQLAGREGAAFAWVWLKSQVRKEVPRKSAAKLKVTEPRCSERDLLESTSD